MAAQALAGLVVAASLLAAGAALRLAQGPISLEAFKPVLEGALADAAPGVRVAVGSATLAWAGRQRGIDVRLTDVQVTSADEKPLAQAGALQIGISPLSLVERKLLIEDIEVFSASVQLIRAADGHFQIALAGVDRTEAEGALLGGFLASKRDPSLPLSYLNHIRLTDARLDVIDSDGGQLLSARVPTAGVRRAGSGLSVDAQVIAIEGSESGGIDLLGTFKAETDTLDLQASLKGLNPARFAATAAPLQPLAAVDLPLHGSVSFRASGAGVIQALDAQLTAESGQLVLTEALAQALGEPVLAQALKVKGGRFAASADLSAQAFELRELAVDFAEGNEVHLPPPVDHSYPLTRLKARARATPAQVTVEHLELDLAGPLITAAIEADRQASPPKAQLKAVAEGLPVDAFRRYWPPRLAPGGYTWSVAHLSAGRVERADLTAALVLKPEGIAVDALSGTFSARNVTVAYLPPLPAVRGVDGTARFDLDSLTIELAGGTSQGLSLAGGTVVLHDFDKPVEAIAIDIPLEGPFRDVLDLISRPPLRYTDRVGIRPEQASGHARVRLQLQFPLLRDLPMERIAVDVHGQVTGGILEQAVAGHAITDANLSISVNDNGLDMNGTLALAGIPANLAWREDFRARAPVKTKLTLIPERVAVAKLAPLLPPGTDVSRFLRGGELDGRVDLTVRQAGTTEIAVSADLTAAAVTLAPAGWSKQPGTPATCSFEAVLLKDTLTRIPNAACRGDGVDISARAGFDKVGAVRLVEIDRFAVGRTDAVATAARSETGGWDIRVGGRSLDVEPLLRGGGTSKREPAAAQPSADRTIDAALNVALDVDSVWFHANGKLDAVQLTAVREKGVWSPVRGAAKVANGSAVTVALRPDTAGRRRLTVEAEDAGTTLQALGLFDDLRGGRLAMTGTYADTEPERPLTGRLRIKDYQIVNAPLLARLLNIMALTGIADALRGEGISFSTLDAPFTWRAGTLLLTDAKAHGTSLGLTASGTVEVETERVDVKGTIVPFYVINSLLGRLPLIGDLFTGGEAGGGVFAATYAVSGPLGDPHIWINPLSIVGPGVLRHLFAVFDLLAPSEPAPSPAVPPPAPAP
ncbi:MAG: AsmA-like C-terminal region-containing protein [Defluviicoccus sp.]|nr:AsmA-like C-terminal region-containing protein [Defluviicoccus sp.]MDG4593174.1 AsmA-like C-terminal region-containing protein [Defluviicoccus sp.]